MKVARLADGSPEIFHTLQGEGQSLGAPAVFLRLSQCNLHCHWCDTPYTWNWEKTPWEHQDGVKFQRTKESLELSSQEIAELISQHQCDRVVITGGEPLLQQKELIELIEHLPQISTIEFETNGTIIPHPELIAPSIFFNVSPKLANSGMKTDLRINFEALKFFRDQSNAVFKFVVCDEEDLAEILQIQATLKIASSRIILMPEGRDQETLTQRAQWLAEVCLTHAFRFSPRLHVILWGNERAR